MFSQYRISSDKHPWYLFNSEALKLGANGTQKKEAIISKQEE